MKKFISIILCLTCATVLFSGCRKDTRVTKYDKNPKVNVLDSSAVAENDHFVLSFRKEQSDISLLSKDSQTLWTGIPEDGADDTEKNMISIRVQDTQLRNESTYESSAVSRVSAEKIDAGIQLTYYFDEVEISVPVCYTLRNDSMRISIDGKAIKQGSKRYQLIAVQPAPMFCRLSVEADDSYLFIPNGLGGTVNNKVTPDTTRSSFGTGTNIASIAVESDTNAAEASDFRCYGLKSGNVGLFCIAEDTPGAVGIQVAAGNRLKNYSTLSPMFYFTDYDYFYGISVSDGLIKQLSQPYDGVISIGVYALTGEDADYNGMARCYRDYLIREGFLKENKTAQSASPYSVTYYGGVLTTSSIAGIPQKTLKKMTTVKEAATMTEELTSATGYAPTVRLSGYGDAGINIGKIAGGYQFSKKLADNQDRLDFEAYCKKNNIPLYTNFNLIFYSKSGNGFSYSGDSAKTAILHAAEIKPVTVPLRDFNDSLKYRLLARSALGRAVDKLLDMAGDKSVSGIALSDLGKASYSDYTDGVEYAVTAKMDTDTKAYLEKIIKSGHRVAVSGGTYFSAGVSDVIFDAPVETNGRMIFQNEIPFYQMVFHGMTPMYSTALNTAADTRYKMMLAASTGTGFGFSLIKDMDTSYMETNAQKLYGMVYEDNLDLIRESVAAYQEIYASVANSKIMKYNILENGITQTVFENGISIYANHTSAEQMSPAGKLTGYGFIMDGEAIE